MNKKLIVSCPQCKINFSYYESASRPFCTERCRMIDLGHWFQETYTVPLKENISEVEEESDESTHKEQDTDQENY